MSLEKSYIHQPALLNEKQLGSMVENKTSYTLKNCEFNIYETHRSAFDVKLHFNDVAFTAMLRGKKKLKLDGKTDYFDYLPGESVLVAPGETMVIDFPEADEAPSQCLSLSLNSDFIKNTLNYLNLHETKVDDTSCWQLQNQEYYLFNTESLTSATNNIMRIAMDNNTHKDLMADFALKELLIRLMQTQASTMIQLQLSKNQSRLGYIIDFIKQNLHQKLNIDQMAKMAYVSKSNFFKMFKEELGISPNDFILKERINLAKDLLKKRERIKEVAYRTGFTDTNYFTRVFKQHEGTTPKSFQNDSLIIQ
ncbi:helix-turn-helix domain-containing protein [Soonwooa sp.]|uniref:helix-turn-helix transcriptional regulator n=1 Tax=Soonwooa sp. TaxID=1938592 RepID=UPI0028A906DF|nr:helix-turn-helix domain-containing protein [Soonwooa sp.]